MFLLKVDGNNCTRDNKGIHDVPNVTEVGARVEHQAKIQDLKRRGGEEEKTIIRSTHSFLMSFQLHISTCSIKHRGIVRKNCPQT